MHEQPCCADWPLYLRWDKSEIFQVSGCDSSSRTIQIRAFDGGSDEIDEDLWSRLSLGTADPSYDWAGPAQRASLCMLLYLLGVAGEIFILTSIYMVMPVGRPSLLHSLIGALAATILWELTRHVLVWYFATLSLLAGSGIVFLHSP